MIICPLCRSTNNESEKRLDVKRLNLLYNDFLGNCVDNLFRGYDEIYKLRCQECDLIFFHPQIVGDDLFYSTLSKKEFYYPDKKDEYTYAMQFVSDNDYVLELGCGIGEFGKKIQRYVGIDINWAAVQMAKERGLNVFCETIEDHSANNSDKYDVICAFQVLEHIANPKKFIYHCTFCLKEGGKLIFSVPSADSFIIFAKNHLLNLPPHHQTWWTDRALCNLQNIFNIKLADIYHEQVQDVHLTSYLHTLYSEIMRQIVPYRRKLISNEVSFKEKIISKLSAYLCDKTIGAFGNDYFRGKGHTVSVVYKKTGIYK